jgi:hypothetical protein
MRGYMLTVDKCFALMADVCAKLVPHAQQLINCEYCVSGSMTASMVLDIKQMLMNTQLMSARLISQN